MKKTIAALLLTCLCVSVTTPLCAKAAEPEPEKGGSSRFGEIMESYGGLSVKDKESIFKIDSKIRKQIAILMNKYVQLEVITQEEADAIVARFEMRSNAAMENDIPIWLIPKATKNLPDDPERPSSQS